MMEETVYFISVFKSEGKGGVGGCYQIEITNLGKNIANQI